VTHDQVEAMTMGDRICIMNKVRLVQIGHRLTSIASPPTTFVARFLGNPPMNLLELPCEATGNQGLLRLGEAGLALDGWPADALRRHGGGNLILGIRPEDLYETTAECRAVRRSSSMSASMRSSLWGLRRCCCDALRHRAGVHRPGRPLERICVPDERWRVGSIPQHSTCSTQRRQVHPKAMIKAPA